MGGLSKGGGHLRGYGALQVSKDGYIFWTRGALWFSLAQFRDDVLLATILPLGSTTTLVQEVCDTL